MADWSDFTLTMTRGDTARVRFDVTIESRVENVSLWQKFWFTVKRSVADTDTQAVAALTSGRGIRVVDGPGGVCEAVIPAAVTRALSNRQTILYADVQGKDASGLTWTLARGLLIVKAEITQASS